MTPMQENFVLVKQACNIILNSARMFPNSILWIGIDASVNYSQPMSFIRGSGEAFRDCVDSVLQVGLHNINPTPIWSSSPSQGLLG